MHVLVISFICSDTSPNLCNIYTQIHVHIELYITVTTDKITTCVFLLHDALVLHINIPQVWAFLLAVRNRCGPAKHSASCHGLAVFNGFCGSFAFRTPCMLLKDRSQPLFATDSFFFWCFMAFCMHRNPSYAIWRHWDWRPVWGSVRDSDCSVDTLALIKPTCWCLFFPGGVCG